ncbi:MAG: hypothetical protein M3328_01605 [Chloroflexota bacterium]|nr:hypothetical protein [Chloroflexota bacterium]
MLVYYSGRRAQKMWSTNPTWHEAPAPLDAANFLYEVETDRLIDDICEADGGPDCHSRLLPLGGVYEGFHSSSRRDRL